MGMKLNVWQRRYWWAVWMVITPIFSLAIFVFTLTDIGPTYYLVYFEEYKFPVWADAIGWLLGTATLLPFPCFLIYQIIKYRKVSEVWAWGKIILLSRKSNKVSATMSDLMLVAFLECIAANAFGQKDKYRHSHIEFEWETCSVEQKHAACNFWVTLLYHCRTRLLPKSNLFGFS